MGSFNKLPRPFLAWLEANDIDVDTTPLWPLTEVDADAGKIRIEQLWFEPVPEGEGPPDRQPVIVGDRVGTVTREFDLIEPMSADLASAWGLMFAEGRREQEIKGAASALRGKGVSLVVVHSGQGLLLATAPMSKQTHATLLHSLKEVLPGVPITIASGIQAAFTTELPEAYDDDYED